MKKKCETNAEAAYRLAEASNWSPSQWSEAEAVHSALHNIVAMDRYADSTEHRAMIELGNAIMREADSAQ